MNTQAAPHAGMNETSGENAGYRLLPHNLEAEQGLLGALLVDNRALEKIDFLKPEHFFAGAHQRIFEAIQKLTERGQTASPVTLKSYFEKDEDLAHIGGADYLVDLAASVVSVINVADYGTAIYDLFLRRELISVGEEIINESHAHTLDKDASRTIELAESRLFGLAGAGETRGGFKTLRDSVLTAIEIAEIAFKTEGHVTGVTTGLRDLDQKLGGLHPSDLLIFCDSWTENRTVSAAANLWKTGITRPSWCKYRPSD